MNPSNNSPTWEEFQNIGCRELTVAEYFSLLKSREDYEERAKAIAAYNLNKPDSDRLIATPGRLLPFRGREVRLYRDTLPGSAERLLKDIEAVQGPFVGQWLRRI